MRKKITLGAKAQEMKARGLLNSKNELMLYGVIGNWGEGMDALSIVREMEALAGDEITIRIHSPGGNIAEGLAMYNTLDQLDKTVNVYIDGVCASMATVIAMAGDNIYTPDNALWMVHRAHNGAEGHAEDLRQAADNLEVFEQTTLLAYTGKGRVTEDRIKEIFATGKDYFMTGAEAVAQGFADHLTTSVKAAAHVDLSGIKAQGKYQNLQKFYAVSAAPTPPNHEANPMKLKQLLSQKAALTNKGIAAQDIVAALALAFNVDESKVESLLAENSTLTDAQAQAGMDAMAGLKAPVLQPIAQTPPAAQDAQAAIAGERKRIADISAMALKHSLPTAQRDDLIANGTLIEDARAVALDHLATHDASRQPSPGLRFTDTTGEAFREGMANAMLNRMQPGSFKLENGGADFRGQSLLGMAADCLERGGLSTRGLSQNELAAKALNTTSDFPEIVSDVANKILLASYQAQPRTFTAFARQTSLSDFKAHNAIEVGGGSQLEKVNEQGEFKRGTLTEGKKSYKLDTYGKIFGFSRQLLINDDLGALDRFMMQVGAQSARNETKVVYDLIKTATGIYTAGNGNLGTGGAVSETTLSEMDQKLLDMKDSDGNRINLSAQYLVVPPVRKLEAQKLLSAVLAATTSNVNVFAGSLELVVEAELSGVANNPWYAFANHALAPALEYAYLNGESGPYMETRTGFEVDGIELKVRHDFGAGFVSHRGTYRNPGV